MNADQSTANSAVNSTVNSTTILLERFGLAGSELLNLAMSQPQNTDVSLALSLEYCENKEFDKAINCLESALKNSPDNVRLLDQLSGLYLHTGQVDTALSVYQTLSSLLPTEPKVTLALALCCDQLGDQASASHHFQSILLSVQKTAAAKASFALWNKAQQNETEAVLNLGLNQTAEFSGNSAFDWSVLNDALSCYINMIEYLASQNRAAECCAHYAWLNDNDYAYESMYVNWADTLRQLGLLEEAANVIGEAERKGFASEDLLATYANLLGDKGEYAEGVKVFERLIVLSPTNMGYYYNAANYYASLNEFQLAEKNYLQAIKLQPDFLGSYNNLANLYGGKGLYSQASHWFNEILKIDPNNVSGLMNYGAMLTGAGELEKSIDYCSRVLELDPSQIGARHNLAYAMCYTPFADEQKVFDAHTYVASLFESEQQAGQNKFAPIELNKTGKAQRLIKIGFIGGDFNQHSVAFFCEPLFKSMDYQKFELTVYANNIVKDAVSDRIMAMPLKWRDISLLNDANAEALILADELDVMVDLSGHTRGNRMPLLAKRVAPIQVNWLGYPNTTGLTTMDYRLTDNIADPVSDENKEAQFYSEKLVRIKDSFLCFQGDSSVLAAQSAPIAENGWVTFGSFNNIAKLTTEVLSLWAELLVQNANSRLILKSRLFSDSAIRMRYEGFFQACGVADHQLLLIEHTASFEEHLRLYDSIDIALDPFPYNGTTTSCEALWMGVPVVTMERNCHRSRVSSSILNQIGHSEWIAKSDQEYSDIINSLIAAPQHLNELRSSLRTKMSTSPLCDSTQFARNFESAIQYCIDDQTG